MVKVNGSEAIEDGGVDLNGNWTGRKPKLKRLRGWRIAPGEALQDRCTAQCAGRRLLG